MHRRTTIAVAAAAATAAIAAAGCGAATTTAPKPPAATTTTVKPAAATATAPKPPKTVTTRPIARQPNTLAPGTKVASSEIVSPRVFVDDKHGFALVSTTAGAQYAAATTDGGKTWRTDSPALHIPAAQGPLAVTGIGALNRRTIFAYGAGNVVDVTSDGGRQWRRAVWSDGTPTAVVAPPNVGLVAFVDSFGSAGRNGPTWQYVSKDGGRTWTYTTRVGG